VVSSRLKMRSTKIVINSLPSRRSKWCLLINRMVEVAKKLKNSPNQNLSVPKPQNPNLLLKF
jgi:hypothetical protein